MSCISAERHTTSPNSPSTIYQTLTKKYAISDDSKDANKATNHDQYSSMSDIIAIYIDIPSQIEAFEGEVQYKSLCNEDGARKKKDPYIDLRNNGFPNARIFCFKP